MRCHTATPADTRCYPNVEWAHNVGIKAHPEVSHVIGFRTILAAGAAESCPCGCECSLALTCVHGCMQWYPGLSTSSTFEDVQRLMHHNEYEKYHCPDPCPPPAWEDPLINARRKEPPRSSFVPYETTAAAVSAALRLAPPRASPRVQLLTSRADHRWTFHFSPLLHQRPSQPPSLTERRYVGQNGQRRGAGHDSSESAMPESAGSFVPFYSTAFNDSSWAGIPVPSNWELLGFGAR